MNELEGYEQSSGNGCHPLHQLPQPSPSFSMHLGTPAVGCVGYGAPALSGLLSLLEVRRNLIKVIPWAVPVSSIPAPSQMLEHQCFVSFALLGSTCLTGNGAGGQAPSGIPRDQIIIGGHAGSRFSALSLIDMGIVVEVPFK
ncbi:hypothetical protein ACI77M_06615 [Pseudomonas fildesensis]|uniref:hypothetical protein n=1 Tax=Pseudomonas fildesensis TaxID=1674920 RepID=UPI00387B57FC